MEVIEVRFFEALKPTCITAIYLFLRTSEE
jgi:hypothetical protein